MMLAITLADEGYISSSVRITSSGGNALICGVK
jgi:hypothetical protein